MADEFQMTMNKVVKWFIICLISVFDPLAICLLLAYNTTLNLTEKSEKKSDDEIKIYKHQDSNNIQEEKNIEKIVEEAKKEAEKEVKDEKIVKEIITQIKEVPVEVPVEKIVEREVIKEVPTSKGPHFSF